MLCKSLLHPIKSKNKTNVNKNAINITIHYSIEKILCFQSLHQYWIVEPKEVTQEARKNLREVSYTDACTNVQIFSTMLG